MPSPDFQKKLEAHKAQLSPEERAIVEDAEKAFKRNAKEGVLQVLKNGEKVLKGYEKKVRAANNDAELAKVVAECMADFDKVWSFTKESQSEMIS